MELFLKVMALLANLKANVLEMADVTDQDVHSDDHSVVVAAQDAGDHVVIMKTMNHKKNNHNHRTHKPNSKFMISSHQTYHALVIIIILYYLLVLHQKENRQKLGIHFYSHIVWFRHLFYWFTLSLP